MKLLQLLLCGLVAACGVSAAPRTIPDYIPVCRRSEGDFNNCIRKAAESLRPKLARGIAELRVPALEPLLVPQVHLEQGTRAVNFNCTLTNLEIYGLSDFSVVSIDADVTEKKQIAGRVKIPNLRVESDYEIDGRILLVPLQGKGRFHANFSETIGDVTLNGHNLMRKGKSYYETQEAVIKLLVTDAKMHFDNLFNGDKMLGPTTNRFLNENSRDILQEITPVVETVTAHIIHDISNKVFSSFPFDQLFPA